MAQERGDWREEREEGMEQVEEVTGMEQIGVEGLA